jgi:hypothetical protein
MKQKYFHVLSLPFLIMSLSLSSSCSSPAVAPNSNTVKKEIADGKIINLGNPSIPATANQAGEVVKPSVPAAEAPVVNDVNASKVIEGEVEFPSPGFTVMAEVADIAANATVSLIDNPTNNMTIASGLTNVSGAFTINPDANFNPQPGNIFVLEAGRRVGGINNNIMTIRTYIRWTGSGWESITTPGIKINALTTAVSIMEAQDVNIAPADVIGKINISNVPYVISNIAAVTSAQVLAVENTVKYILLHNEDPVKSIIKSGVDYIVNDDSPISVSVNSFSPLLSTSGNILTIYGLGLGSDPANVTVTFMFPTPVGAEVLTVTENQITVTIPTVAGQSANLTGKIKVSVFGNQFTSTDNFTLSYYQAITGQLKF